MGTITGDLELSRCILQGSLLLWEETSAVTHQHDSVSVSLAQHPSKADSKEITGTLSDWHPAVNAPCHFSVTELEKTSGIRRVLPSSRLRLENFSICNTGQEEK